MKQHVSLFFLFLLTACGAVPVSPIATLPPPRVVIETMTPSPIPTLTLTPSPTPTTEQWIYPYTLDGLIHHEFQSGAIHVEAKLEMTDIYTRYLIDYPSNGLTITGIMQIPVEGHAPFPVIIMNHGYFPRDSYVSGDGTWRAAEYLNKHGYLTIAPDYRSWGGSDIGPSLFYSGLVTDVINLLDAVATVPEADAKRIGMWGHSMGGGTTMKVLVVDSVRNPNRIKAAVLYSPVSADDADLIDRWGMGCIGDIAAGEKIVGCNSSDIVPLDLPLGLIQAYREAASDPTLLKETSPFYHLDLIHLPIQISYGTEDGKIIGGTPPDWSKKLYQAMKNAGADVKLFGYEGEGHSFNGNAWIAFMERASQLFDKYVKSSE